MKKLKQIKVNLPLTIVGLLVVPIILITYLNYQQTDIIEGVMIEKDQLEAMGSKYEDIFDTYDSFISEISQSDELQFDSVTPSGETADTSRMPMTNDPALTYHYEQYLSELNDSDYIINLFIGTENGALYVDSLPDTNLLGYDPRTTDWYTQASESRGEVVWTSPYTDRATGTTVITAARTIADDTGATIGVVGLDFDMSYLAGMIRQDMLMYNVVIVIVAVIVSLVIVTLFVKRMLYNINVIRNEMNQLADGQLSGKEIKTKGEDEFSDLANAMNRMKENLTSMIHSIMSASDKVLSQSDTLTHSANHVKEGSEQIAATMEELSSGSESQSSSTADLATMMDTYNKNVLSAASSSEQIASTTKNVVKLSDSGAEQIKLAVNQMNHIHTIVHDSFTKVQGLDEKSQHIGNIVSVIQEIADQTNLLALNAAIEAARAGEHGQGFAVVADEVRKLAEQVGHSVTDISGTIATIQTESSEVAKSLEGGYQAVEQGSNQMQSTGQSFDEISQSINEMVEKVKTIVSDLKDVSNDSQKMNQSIDEIAAVSEESAAAIEETAASVEETNNSMEEVSNSAEELAKLANSLEEQVSVFKL